MSILHDWKVKDHEVAYNEY